MATLKELLADETTAKELAAQETPEAALAYLQGKGVEITMTELKTQMEEIFAEAGELSDDDLAGVAGGGKKIKVYKIEGGVIFWWELLEKLLH